jgi:hypothetical protein
MIDIRSVAHLYPDDLQRLVTGYTSDAKYQISKTESDQRFALALELVPLPEPYRRHYDHLDIETLEHYRQVPALGFSFGAYDVEQCVGIALAEPRHWNKSLWVWELHVAETHRRRIEGIDLSYYSNDDFPEGEIAIFMKKRLVQ